MVSYYIKTIFNNCFEFKKLEIIHPYQEVCDSYEVSEYDRFLNDFYKNFKIETIPKNSKPKKNGTLTGYYEPEIIAYNYPKKGSYPLYRHPKIIADNFDYKVPRKMIKEGYLKNKKLEIAWIENEIEAFFLHIQGSGRLKLENNQEIKVRYAGSNEKKYSSKSYTFTKG